MIVVGGLKRRLFVLRARSLAIATAYGSLIARSTAGELRAPFCIRQLAANLMNATTRVKAALEGARATSSDRYDGAVDESIGYARAAFRFNSLLNAH